MKLSAQRNNDISCLGLAAAALLILAIPVVLFVVGLGKSPPEVLVMSAKSPDGQYMASEYSVDLGAVGGNTYIRLKRTADASAKGDVVAYDSTTHTLLPPCWNGNRTLVIGVHDAKDQLMQHAEVWHDVRLVYQKRKYPDE